MSSADAKNIRSLRFIDLDRRGYFGPLDLYSRSTPYKSASTCIPF